MIVLGCRGRLWCLPAIAAVFVGLAACVQTLPDQDRRVYATAPVAKVSADILWQDYLEDPVDADLRYWGKVIEVTGEITGVSLEGARAFLLFRQTESLGVQAWLLDDEAAEIMGAVGNGDRVTLKCFCEGRLEHVVLKSCIRP
jgi:hypothetical protein